MRRANASRMPMTPKDLQARTQRFAIQIIELCRGLPQSPEGQHVRLQLIRAATSVASNYRAACRARTRAEFGAKLGVVVEEADEADFWLSLSVDAKLISAEHAAAASREADELVAIFVQSRNTVTRRR
jgi:four helix bundle protein